MELIKDLWRGDIPLVRTYWLFGCVPTIIFYLGFAYIDYLDSIYKLGSAILWLFILYVLDLIYSLFMSVAIWRSANKYQGMQRFVILAKVSVIFGVMAMLKLVFSGFQRQMAIISISFSFIRSDHKKVFEVQKYIKSGCLISFNNLHFLRHPLAYQQVELLNLTEGRIFQKENKESFQKVTSCFFGKNILGFNQRSSAFLSFDF